MQLANRNILRFFAKTYIKHHLIIIFLDCNDRFKRTATAKKLPDIFLIDFQGLGLIIDYPIGIAYSNQVGGYSVLPMSREGVFMIIDPVISDSDNQELRIYEILFNHFTGKKWGGWCSKGIDIETADFIDSILEKSLHCKYMDLKVNRNKLENCMEAWIEVTFSFPKTGHYSEFCPKLESSSGTLTWQNSD